MLASMKGGVLITPHMGGVRRASMIDCDDEPDALLTALYGGIDDQVIPPLRGRGQRCRLSDADLAARCVQRWRSGMPVWAPFVPAAGAGPRQAVRFFVDRYRPQLVYVLDTDHVWRTNNGGGNWVIDTSLERVLTLDRFSFSQRGGDAPLRDMAFGISDEQCRAP